VAARVAIHRGDVPAARRELVNAQRLRHLLTYATPHLAVQARIELIRVHLALADVAGARTLDSTSRTQTVTGPASCACWKGERPV
jgi:LuxR family maltose regulon positive regulatory protein